jgi:hypothetical protein
MRPGQLLWVLAVVTAAALPACKGKPGPAPAPTAGSGTVPWPLEDPSSYCRASCPIKVRCRLGQTAGTLYTEEVEKCHLHCLSWIKHHADEAAALHPCYAESGCNALRACLAEVARIVSDRTVPAKIKECTDLCSALGTCQGDETDCRLRCKAGEVPMYRALMRCGTKRCPELRPCVEEALQLRR